MKFNYFLYFNLLHIKLIESHLKVLLFGDSIDRYALQDWCLSSKGVYCPTVDETWGGIPTTCVINSTNPIPLSDYFKHSSRINSWTVTVCDNYDQNITLAFLFNMQGVSPNSPWFNPRNSHHGLISYNENTPKTVKDAFDHFERPAFPILQKVIGTPDAVSINSYFWDIARLLSYGGEKTCNTTSLRHKWVQSWAKNASELIDVIKETLPNTKWFGWRMAHQTTDNSVLCRFDLIREMNLAAEKFSKSKNIHLQPWLAKHPLVNKDMRDRLHPGLRPNVDYMNLLIKKIKLDLLL